MKEYIQVVFQPITAEQTDMLIALLSEEKYEGFEEGPDKLNAFIASSEFDEIVLENIAADYNISYTTSTIEATNWNAVWESNFQPVIVDDLQDHQPWAGIRAHFHDPIPGVKHEIVITPKMSFGTGHHATTYMMMQQMQEMDFTGKSVFDFGTGTGVLAILAEKLGAATILATDNDEWSIENTIENIGQNHCSRIRALLADTVSMEEEFDIILANINKNVILANIPALVARLKPGGTILFSGLLAEDEADILAALAGTALSLKKNVEKNKWISLRFAR